MTTSTGDGGGPYTVALVAMGPSYADYIRECLHASSRWGVADETWAINAMAAVLDYDRAFIMDDLDYFAKAARENTPLRGYGDWLWRKGRPPILTQRIYDWCPSSVEYPLQAVVQSLGYAYLNSTVAYAVAYAMHAKVKHLKIYGCDFTQALAGGDGQGGRACVEFWLGRATMQGMKVTIAPSSTLCDQTSGRKLYGWSTPPSP